MSCSRTQYSAYGESQTSDPSISSLTLYHRATALRRRSVVMTALMALYKWNTYTCSDKQNFTHEIVNIFLSIILSICFGCSKEPSYRDYHKDGSFEYP